MRKIDGFESEAGTKRGVTESGGKHFDDKTKNNTQILFPIRNFYLEKYERMSSHIKRTVVDLYMRPPTVKSPTGAKALTKVKDYKSQTAESTIMSTFMPTISSANTT